MSWLDRFLLGVAPGWATRRLRARASAQALARTYDAAATSRRTSGWSRSSTDANAAAQAKLNVLREVSRDLYRNNGWAKRGVGKIATNTVGWGIEAKPVGVEGEHARQVLTLWRDWSETPACDFDGLLTFTGIQRLVMQTVALSGEALIMREAATSADGLPVPLRIHVLEPDYLDLDKNRDRTVRGDEVQNEIVQGIELDGAGRRVAYWLFEAHPGARGLLPSHGSRRVDAERVIHVFRPDRPGQKRGVPWLAAAITKLQDFDDYDDAILMQQKIAACFSAFVQDMDGAATAISEQDDDDEQLETLEPGHIQYLDPGQSVTFASPPSAAGHGNFSETTLRRIAASLDVTYEDLTGDYSRVNFSSARMARISHWASVHEWRWLMLIPQFCDRVWQWVMDSAKDLEGWPDAPRATWSAPPMPMLEPEKEGLAAARLVRSGVKTLYQTIREQGEDPRSHLEEYAEGNALLDELGIVLDSDARRVSAAGLSQPIQPADE